MQVSIESSNGLERQLKIGVPADKIDQEVTDRLQKATKTVTIKGFRKGKVPLKVVKQQFGAGVRQEVVGEIVNSSFYEAIQQEDLRPVGQPRIDDINDSEGKDLEYTAIFEVYPEVQFYDYTKNYTRFDKVLPKNYHLTFSYSEANKKYIDLFKPIWKTNYNIAVVFKGKTLPKTFKGRKVINGDITDHRFLDIKGVVVGLLAKGKAKKDNSGFALEVETLAV